MTQSPSPSVDEVSVPAKAPERSELDRLRARLRMLETCGIIELAVINPNVMDYMRHWEGRAEAAERAAEPLTEEDPRVLAAIEAWCKVVGLVPGDYLHIGSDILLLLGKTMQDAMASALMAASLVSPPKAGAPEFTVESLAELYGGEIVERFKLSEWGPTVKLIVQQAIEHDRRSPPPKAGTGEPVPVAWQTGERELALRWIARLSAKLGSKPDHADDSLWLDRLHALLSAAPNHEARGDGVRVTREAAVAAMSIELEKSGRFDTIKSMVWASRLYDVTAALEAALPPLGDGRAEIVEGDVDG